MNEKRKPDKLDEVLNAVSLLLYCREADRNGKKDSPLGAIIGEMDWAAELYRLTHGGEPAMEEYRRSLDPNAKQVGGKHYRLSDYQHWDFVADNFDPGYFIAMILKYVARWKEKDGVKDLRKAEHFAEKLASLYDSGKFSFNDRKDWHSATKIPKEFDRYRRAYNLGIIETEVSWQILVYASAAELLRARDLLARLINEADAEANKRGLYGGSGR